MNNAKYSRWVAALLISLCIPACVCNREKEPYVRYLERLPHGGDFRFQKVTPYWLKQELQYYAGFNLAGYRILQDRFPHLQEIQEYAKKRFEVEATIYEKSLNELERIEKLMTEQNLSLYRYDRTGDGKNESGLILLDKHGNAVEKLEGWWMP